jgi:hypothetical protein
MANELKTYGDLKKAIKSISLKQKGEKIAGLAVDTISDFIPGLGTAKTTFDFIKAAISKPDAKKTKTWLDKLDIDDSMSKIIDNAVENGFMQIMSKTIEGESDSKPLEQDFNMNQKLVDYLKQNYQGRTVTGIQENKMKTQQLRKIIREEIIHILNEEDNDKTEIEGNISSLVSYLKKLDIPNLDPSKINTTISLVKQNKILNVAANKILADIMIGLMKSDDTTLLNNIFTSIRNIKTK